MARFDGPAASFDTAVGLAVDGDGRVYVAGTVHSTTDVARITTVVYDATGSEVRVAMYRPPGEDGAAAAAAIRLDAAGGVLIAGTVSSSPGETDYLKIKYDAGGAELWARRYDGGAADAAVDTMVDRSGNVYVTGRSGASIVESDYATVKYSPTGEELWVRRYDGAAGLTDFATALDLDAAGNVFVTGRSRGPGRANDFTTVKYSPDGTRLWDSSLPGSPPRGPPGLYDAEPFLVVDGAGFAHVAGRFPHGIAVKYDSGGRVVWRARPVTRPGGVPDALAVDASGNVLLAGSEDNDYATIKLDSAGDEVWTAAYGTTTNGQDLATDVAFDGEGSIYVTGTARQGGDTDLVTIKYSVAGEQLWVSRYDGGDGSEEHAVALAIDADGNVYVTGRSVPKDRAGAYATIKYDRAGRELWAGRLEPTGAGPASPAALVVSDSVHVTGSSGNEAVTVTYDRDGHETWRVAEPGLRPTDLAVDAQGSVYVTGNVAVVGEADLDFVTVRYEPPRAGSRFVRGDTNADGALNVTDAIATLRFLFLGGRAPTCERSADVDDNGAIDVSDAVATLEFLFLEGRPPAPPFPDCGDDPTPDTLDCSRFLPCP